MTHPAASQGEKVENLDDRRKALSRFASDTAHELIGPVDQVSSLLALFVRRYGHLLDEDAGTLLGHVEAAGARLAGTGKALRACFRVFNSACARVPVDTREALDGALFLLEAEIRESKAQISQGPLPEVSGDPNLLRLLFRELIDNSLKFGTAGTRVEIRIAAERSADDYIFQVSDNGMGINAENADAAFVPFKKFNGKGPGMGLTLARAIVEMHGCRIWIEGAASGGTSVFFSIPLSA